MKKYIYVDHNTKTVAGFYETDEENHSHPEYEAIDITGSNAKMWKYEGDSVRAMSDEEVEAILSANLLSSLINDKIRKERNDLLSESDWTQLADSALSAEKKAEWATYRQSLRDFPATITSIEQEIIWPTKP